MERNRAILAFLLTAAILAVPAVVAVASHGKLELHAAINAHHAPWADVFFSHATHLADGLVPTVVALLFLFMGSWRSFFMLAFGNSVGALITQFLKRQVFPGHHRPGRFVEGLGDMHWVADIELYHHFSFPSGHATAAFTLCMALAVVAGRLRIAVGLALVAAVLAFSRVYLSQHFTEDILAGAFVGCTAVLGVHYWLYRSPFSRKAWLDKRPFR
jgi:membrane-associated phospholipid phosphatase